MDLRISELTSKLMGGLQQLNDLNEVVANGIETLYSQTNEEQKALTAEFSKAEKAYREILLKLVYIQIEENSNYRNITQI